MKLVLFDDSKELAATLQTQLSAKLGSKGSVALFSPDEAKATEELYEKRLAEELQAAPYDNATIYVADRDLSRTNTYRGLSESAVKRVADGLAIPECAYARGHGAEDDFLESAELREARIVVSLKDGEERFAERVISIAEGFDFLAVELPKFEGIAGKRSPGRLLAALLGKPEYSDKISLYASGDQNRLSGFLKVAGKGAEQNRRLACLLGYWLWDSVLRYPGVVVNQIAAGSYLNIGEAAIAEPDVQSVFASARYSGPFAHAVGPLWWRGMLDDLIAGSGCTDGREFASKRLGRDLSPSQCCEDASKPAGYYCMFSHRPVSLENSHGGLSWFPRGADLARVSRTSHDEIGPWITA